jgi:2-polyprenyl-6-methoxyphenol hydroxylase-like FAD-dependent oxidoreductase
MEHDVVIAGAGPVGLLLACELRLHGISTLVLERLTEPSNTIKAGSLSVRTTEALDRRGLFERLDEVQQAQLAPMLEMIKSKLPPGAEIPLDELKSRFGKGHFAGLFQLDPSKLTGPETIGGAFVPQQELERILAERAAELGADVLRGHDLTGFGQDADGVTIIAGGKDFRARWLVGCDGGRSTVRKLAGFDFPGTAPTITGHQALVELADPEKLTLGWVRTTTGLCVYGPVPGRILTVEFDGPPADRDTEVTLAELQTSLRHVSGTDVTITKVHTATRWSDNTRQAGDYRLGRVLLAGDAAHVHSPFGGQGLNTGLQDAMNLGWKLAAVARGRVGEALLDTYTSERHPVAKRVLDNTRAQVALIRPDEQTTSLRELFSELMELGEVNQYLIEMMQASEVRYPADGDHPLAGRFVPDLKLGTTRLAELLADGRGVLLDLADNPVLREGSAPWSDRVQVVTAQCPDMPDLQAVLVRPDGYAAWAAPSNEPVTTALTRWFGPS